MTRRFHRPARALLAVAALALLTLGWLNGAFDGPQNALVNERLPFYRTADLRPRWDRWSSWHRTADFALVDQQRREFDQRLLERRPTVVGFFFAGCASVCPVSVEVLREVDAQLARTQAGRRPQVLLLTITPEFDTPDTLARYAARMRLPSDWILATGQTRDIDRLAGSLLSDVRTPVDGAEPAHARRTFLLDRQRRIRGVYDGGSLVEMHRLALDYARLLSEPDSAWVHRAGQREFGHLDRAPASG